MTTESPLAVGRDSRSALYHPALFYGSQEEYLVGVGTYVRDALAEGQPVLVAVPGPSLVLLREELGAEDARVTWVDMTLAGRNPGRILSLLQDFADRRAGAHDRVSIVGEPIWVGRTPAEAWEATRSEALINLAFEGREIGILCPYDTALPVEVLAQAYRTHPVVRGLGPYGASSRYSDPHEVCRDCDSPLPEPGEAVVVAFDETGLGRARDEADRWAAAAGLSSAGRADWLLAVGEATSNSVRHGGGRGRLRMWREGDELIAEISDRGTLADPLTGLRRPDPVAAAGGRGVWIMHQLCDLVEIRAVSQGLVLRLHLGLK
ncbi:anti-sigma factor RsbA family regulatory protein [Streptomyces sp. NPDC091272]|uniref:anti-sigma factor RsbA family regulatory protein n=1 Tax=Streptomyces sp. NPDC091272 TaxID=3365981 RepID=UPI0038070CDB